MTMNAAYKMISNFTEERCCVAVQGIIPPTRKYCLLIDTEVLANSALLIV
jgi:hypothetical protein